MVTYVLSQQPQYWDVARYIDELSGEPIMRAETEQAALGIVLKRAKEETPSQIIRILLSGESQVLAKFEAEEH